MAHAYQPLHFHDWGKLLLALVMLYAYFAFSQFLIIWAGNLPEEMPFYLRRLRGGWQYVGLAIILFHFALPVRAAALARAASARASALAARGAADALHARRRFGLLLRAVGASGRRGRIGRRATS